MSKFVTQRLPLACWLHAEKLLEFSHCEEIEEGKASFSFNDPEEKGEAFELKFDDQTSLHRFLSAQRFLRKKMHATLRSAE